MFEISYILCTLCIFEGLCSKVLCTYTLEDKAEKREYVATEYRVGGGRIGKGLNEKE